MRKKICSLILVLGFASLSLVMTSESAQSQDDSLVIGSLDPVPADTQVAVNVRLKTTYALSSISIPLTFYNPADTAVSCDSVHWSEWLYDSNPVYYSGFGGDTTYLDNTNTEKKIIVNATWIYTFLPPGDTTLFTLYFTTSPYWDPDEPVKIDTFSKEEPILRFEMFDTTTFPNAVKIVPGLKPGFLGPTWIREVDSQEALFPQQFILGQNYPNPFNPTTVIRFALPQDGRVQIEVFNILGQKIATLVDDYLTAGYKETGWDGKDSGGTDVASGIYFYRIRTDNFTDVKKMIFLK